MTRFLIPFACALWLTACSSGETPVADAPLDGAVEEATAEAPTAEVATYAVPGLDEDLGKALAMAVGEIEGVDSARPDQDGGVFEVTFRPAASDPAAILETVQTVSAEATLQGVAPAAGAAKKDCGGCPKKHKCPKPTAETAG